jgi:hypothetical protein
MSNWKRHFEIRMEPVYYMIALAIVMLLVIALLY